MIQKRESEPQTHDAWNADNIEDEEDRKKVRDTIKKLDAWINKQIDLLSYVDDTEEFEVEGLDFLNLEYDDSNGIEEMQRPFDEIVSKEEDEQEVLAIQTNTNLSKGTDKTSSEDPKIGGKEEGNQERIRDGKEKGTGNGNNTTGSGATYHEISMKYVKTPYDSEKNIYRVIIRPIEDLKNSEIHFFRCTDSGELEKINVKRASLDGVELKVSTNTVKNINLKDDEDTEIEVEFETKRKCVMEVRVYVQG